MLFGGGWESNTTVVPAAGTAGKKRKRTKSETGSQPNVARALDKIDKQLVDAPAAKPSKKQKKSKQEPKTVHEPASVSQKANVQTSPPKPSAPTSTSATGLTPLQASMKKKLDGARFRHINEVLYKVDSAEATSMMQADPKIFDEVRAAASARATAHPAESAITHLVSLWIPQASRELADQPR